ncbi:hypothetical protein HCN44_000086 [Aphidius gifuensis]|uniref:Uncharacterized protein n=1 Tax=Aphidius gifuensis TaxID=684658 RepID=A0A834XP19_APHGI|nr:uncharacterized protein LOC122853993 [Aphidius gifuensis]KAF7990281.1 hypothetical protein HCN44_000086 [Aphidius gifuensis]
MVLFIGSLVGNGLLTTLAIGLGIWVILLRADLRSMETGRSQCKDTFLNKSDKTVSARFSLKEKISLKELEYDKSQCLIPMVDYVFINTETSFDSSPTFEVNKADKCIHQKNFLDKGVHNLNVTVKKTDTNETMEAMVTFNVAAAEKSVFKTTELVFVDTKKDSANLEVQELYTTYKSDNSKVQTKIQSLNVTNQIITLDRSDLNGTNELVVIANNNDTIFKKASIKVCYLKPTELPVIKTEQLKYNKTDTANKISVKAVTKSSCTIDTTYSASDSRPYEVKTNGDITLLEGEVATNKTFLVTANTVVGENKGNVTIIVV